jgi:Ca2+-binding RTX toxin-like protein
MNRTVLLVALVAMLTAMLAGVAYAEVIKGTNGPDKLMGTDEEDTIRSLGGADHIFGREDADHLYGGNWNDTIRGNEGRDHIFGEADRDHLLGNRASDWIYTADGEEDFVDCGRGDKDRASVDKLDTVKRCEMVKLVPPRPFG